MDAVFQALAHAGRRKILDIVKNLPGCSVNEVSSNFGMSRIAVMKHLKFLEEANLIVSQKQGRTRQLYFNAVPIQMIYDRWATEYSAFWASQVTDLKFIVESKIEATKRSQDSTEKPTRTEASSTASTGKKKAPGKKGASSTKTASTKTASKKATSKTNSKTKAGTNANSEEVEQRRAGEPGGTTTPKPQKSTARGKGRGGKSPKKGREQ